MSIITRPRIVNCLSLLLVLLVLVTSCKQQKQVEAFLSVHFTSNINNLPRFSWKIKANQPNFKQSAVQLIIATSIDDLKLAHPKVWDSGKVYQSTNLIDYNGEGLKRGSRYYARVKVWNDAGVESDWSEAQPFYVPINYPDDWDAQWITYHYDKDQPLPVFTKEFSIHRPEELVYARLYISAPGFYEAFLNEDKIGENVLDPGQTNYNDYTFYTAYEVPIETEEENYQLKVMLGNGWYNQNLVWGRRMIYGQPVFIAQLVLKYKDGSQEIIATDDTWQWHYGPITFSNIYAGESYDARLENDNKKHQALPSDKHPRKLLEQYAPPIQKMGELKTLETFKNSDSTYVVDFGQNFAGWVRLKIHGEKGQKITLRLVEELHEDGSIDIRSTGSKATKVVQTQSYICKGDGLEVWEPQFAYFGFRYAEISGLSSPPSQEMFTGIIVYSSMQKTGEFECSEPAINKLHQMADWTLKSNVHSIPTDCPHREKCGWTGDAHTLAKVLIYNYDAQEFLSKYMFDMRSSARNTNKELYFGLHFHDRSVINKPKGIPTMIVPGRRTSGIASPDWGTAVVQLPWYLYLYYGDRSILQEFYPDMKTWVTYINKKNEDGIIPHGLGDWCPPGGNKNIDCPVKLSSTAFHILDLSLMAKSAKVLGLEEDVKKYSRLRNASVQAFNAVFFDKEKGSYGGQTANILALDMEICPEEERHRVAQAIIDDMHANHNGFISSGIFGITRLFQVLSEEGFEDDIYRLLTKKGENSFAYMWEHYDATTLWEVLPFSLQSQEMGYRSHSHPMQGGYDEWFFSGIVGIKPCEENPGFKTISFKPYLTNHLSQASGTYESPYGLISSSWIKSTQDLSWTLTIPENTTGKVYIPAYNNEVKVWVDNVETLIQSHHDDFAYIGEFPSGTYIINVETIKQDK